jgi:hypothetical protein
MVPGEGSTVWVMDRDERMMEWFAIVRVSNVQTIRWLLGTLNGSSGPVSTRQAQAWCARMQTAGYIDRVNVGGAGGSIVWGTFAGTGKSQPDVYRQTTRHEIAVSTACSRYVTAGYAWQQDERAQSAGEHQTDGLAVAGDWVELIEVELTAKRPARYQGIFRAFRNRLDDGASQVAYLCTPDAGRAVRASLDATREGLSIQDRVQVHDVFDRRGLWPQEQLPEWIVPAAQRETSGHSSLSAQHGELSR